jgi:hypothetical protein
MILISYSNDPTVINMTGNSISFADRVFIHGDNQNDAIVIDFQQPDSTNTRIVGPTRRQFPIARSGSHSMPDGLIFQRAGGQEIFNVRSTAYLQSNPGGAISFVLTIIAN